MKKGKYVSCVICNKIIYRKPHQLSTKRFFCSRKCYNTVINPCGKTSRNWKGGKIRTKCVICHKSVYRFPCFAKRKFCSRNCADKYRSLYIRGKNHPTWKGIKREKGYIWVYAPNHPHSHQGYIKQHRLIMEKHIHRFLNPVEVVHHINNDPLDNRIKNLKILTQSEHVRIHKPRLKANKKSKFLVESTV